MILKPIEDGELKARLEAMPDDHRSIYLIADKNVRLTVVSATSMLNKMRANHNLGLLESYILGQAYIAGALLSSTIKGNDRLSLQIECGGPVKGLSVEAWACGAVRGYLLNNHIELAEPLKSLDTSPFFGPGFLSITKYIEGESTPFTGTVMLQSGNIANDLAVYFNESEQTPTLFYISINFDKKGRITGAGGLFIQALPGCSEDILTSLQEKASHLSNLSKSIEGGTTADEYIASEFASYSPEKLDSSFIGFSCPCSEKSFTSYIKNISAKEQEEILKGAFPLELECLNCGTTYKFTKSELEALWKKENN
jgi:Disulfide bond chaperones of the HSP33 family